MKLPGPITRLWQKDKPLPRFLTLLLDVDSVQAAAWHAGVKGTPQISGVAAKNVEQDSWEERLEVCDRVITLLDDKEGTSALHQVILGLPHAYLTSSGDIQPAVRAQIKKITQALELKPMGFVPVHQALIYALKHEEGVPPSVILVGVNRASVTVSLYKIGVLTGVRVVEKSGELVEKIEEALGSFKDVEILPSRMLLYGADQTALDEVKTELLRHPWQTKANFLHFPKIEVLPAEFNLFAVSLAGTSELGELLKADKMTAGEAAPEASEAEEKRPEEFDQEESIPVPEETPVESEPEAEEEVPAAATAAELVTPQALGFKAGTDILEEKAQISQLKSQKLEQKLEKKEEAVAPAEVHPPSKRLVFPKLPPIAARLKLPSLKLSAITSGSRPLLVACAILLAAAGGLVYWVLPRATVTVLESPKTFAETANITIDPQATAPDEAGMVIAGKAQEKSISGEKKIPVTGKKKVGDPAKGNVTIYNKTTSSRLFRKGAVLVASSLQFTLDDDISVASASENLVSGTVTFGKGSGTITAAAIGSQSNLPAGTDFSFKDTSSTIAVARNEAALSGGTSREVTVVSRADYDSLVKALTNELLDKAKVELATNITGGEKLIEETVKTTVTAKSFAQELDQEANELSGNVTVTVAGISYNEGDLAALLSGVLAGKVPAGYALDATRTTTQLSNVSVKKDGKITAKAQYSGIALPQLDTAAIQRTLAGKSLTAAQQYLGGISGVAGVEFSFRFSPTRSRLPINWRNISVTLAIKE